MTQHEIKAAKNRHLRVAAGESLMTIYGRPDGVFSELEQLLIAEEMHAEDCLVLANAFCEQNVQSIDEITHVPDFVGDAEIEVGGVIYVRKSSQQSHLVNERLLNAAIALINENTVGDDEIWEESQATSECRQAVVVAEAEIAEREKSVTEEWLRTAGFNSFSIKFNVDGSFCVYFDSQRKWLNFTPETNCGDVLDLMRVLGGAK